MSIFSIVFPIEDVSHVGEARRRTVALAGEIGLSDTACGQVAIVITELATNVLRHARGGEILVRALHALECPAGMSAGDSQTQCTATSLSPGCGIEIVALDAGSGMANVQACLKDGYSTGPTPGTGLGAVKRLADDFEIYSVPGEGTVVMARLWCRQDSMADREIGPETPACPFEIGAICVPKPGQIACGDAWAAFTERDRLVVAVIDGLGHGPIAAEASEAAVREFGRKPARTATEHLDDAHSALSGTRGAVMAVADIRAEEAVVRYTGTGNIAGFIQSGSKTSHMVSMNGTVGQVARAAREFAYPWDASSFLVMTSDGIQSHIRLEARTGILGQHPAIVAAVVYRDGCRRRDDATVFVARGREVSGA